MALCRKIVLKGIDILEVQGKWKIKDDIQLISTSGTNLLFTARSGLEITYISTLKQF